MHKRTVSRLILALLLVHLFTLPFEIQLGRAEPNLNRSGLSVTNEVHLPVPFYYQEKDYYCGPAALEMVFDFYGENVSQSEIACVARSIGDPWYVTYTDELRRAGHFSNISTSIGGELPANITGYTLRKLGYAASEAQGMSLATLKNYLDQGKPLVLLMWYSNYHVSTHYRVATGYNDTHVFLHDPWNKPLWGGTYGGPDLAFNNTQFLDLWSYFNYWALYVSPWMISLSTPAYVPPGTPFLVNSTITYPQTLPNAFATYPASSCNASITLPANLSLAQGETQEKTIGAGFLQPGDISTLSWTLVADSPVTGTINITAEGSISGAVGASPNYPPYTYEDRIGATVNFTVDLPSELHDVAVTNVILSKTIVGQACCQNVTVTITNLGSYTEDFNITFFANDTAIQTENTILTSEVTANITFVSDATGLVHGNYTLSVYVKAVPGETNVANNNFTFSVLVHVGVPGDVSGPLLGVYDIRVNMRDISYMILLFNTKPTSPNWNPNADVSNDGIVNMSDISVAIINFNKHE